jgi:hypothetical protein
LEKSKGFIFLEFSQFVLCCPHVQTCKMILDWQPF